MRHPAQRLCFLVILFAAAGTAPAADPAPTPPGGAPSARSSSVAFTNSMDVLDDTRPLSFGDKVSLRVVEDRKPPIETYVTDSGDMEVPLIGRVKARGKTCKALAREIKAALDKEYFYNCNVILGLDTAANR